MYMVRVGIRVRVWVRVSRVYSQLRYCCYFQSARWINIHDRRYFPSAIGTLSLLTLTLILTTTRTHGRKIAWSRSNCPSLGT